MYILHKEESEAQTNYTLNSESQRVVLSLNKNEDTPDDAPDAHTIRFWPLASNINMTTIGFKKSDEEDAIKAFRKILGAAKDSLANLSDFELTEPKPPPRKRTAKSKSVETETPTEETEADNA